MFKTLQRVFKNSFNSQYQITDRCDRVCVHVRFQSLKGPHVAAVPKIVYLNVTSVMVYFPFPSFWSKKVSSCNVRYII